MIQCPVCQVSNEPNSQFCRECGNRIERRNEPRPKLKSPLLSGYEEPETYDDEPNVSKLRGVKPAAKPKLRSPLLQDSEDDDSFDNPPQDDRKSSIGPGKSKLRSPLLGDGDDDDDDFDSPPSGSGGMPRIRRKASNNSALNPSISTNQDTGSQGAKGGKPKLRSRLLDTSDYDEVDDDWDEDEPKEDAHALRSPLLRARSHQDDRPEKSQNTVPPQQTQKAQAPMPAPVPTTPMTNLNPPASMVPPAQAPMPMPNPMPTQPSPHNPQSPSSTASGIFAQQPSFQPPNLPAPTPEIPNQKPLQMPGQPDENYLPPPIPQREATPPIPHPLAKSKSGASSSPEIGPDDRRSSSSRRQSNTDRRSRSGLLGAGIDTSDDMDDDYQQGGRSRQSGSGSSSGINAGQLKMVCLASICGVIFKVVYIGYIFKSFGLSPTSLWIILDQLAFIFLCVGLIMFSSQNMSSR